MRAKKSLGQHFLRSGRAIAKIVEAGEVTKGDTVLEIGPGEGVLTSALLEAGADVVAVEKDDALFALLKENFATEMEEDRLELLHGDILELEAEELKATNWKLLANIPYNITGAILRKFLSLTTQPRLMVLLVQKEVAERIVARDGKESILSISVKAYGTPIYIERVLAGSFTPPPKVDSAILKITAIHKGFFSDFTEEAFFELLRAGFASKRKKLASNIAILKGKVAVAEAFKQLGLDDNLRAEDVSIDGWKRLGKALL